MSLLTFDTIHESLEQSHLPLFLFLTVGYRVSEGEEAVTDATLPPADLQAAGN